MTSSPAIDRTKWHKPTHSGHYDERATHYEGIACRCKKCEQSFVFSAEAQKHAFELEQRYPGWLPTLCSTCHTRWRALKQEILEFERQWQSCRTELSANEKFLNHWLNALKEAQEYQQNDFTSGIQMLIKTLSKVKINHHA